MELTLGRGGLELRIRGRRGLITAGLLGLVAASLIQELRKPPAARTWHGTLAGLVPYDYRSPSWERLRRAMWDPADPRLFKPRSFGVGWDPNLATLGRGLGLVPPSPEDEPPAGLAAA
jgi:hypothetical protein